MSIAGRGILKSLIDNIEQLKNNLMIECFLFFKTDYHYLDFWELVVMGEKPLCSLMPPGLYNPVWLHSFTGKGKGRIPGHWEKICQDMTKKVPACICVITGPWQETGGKH